MNKDKKKIPVYIVKNKDKEIPASEPKTEPKTESETNHDIIISSAEGVIFKMIQVEGGTFTMGPTDEQHLPDNNHDTANRVTLPTYYISETLVTQGLWKVVMGSNPFYSSNDNLPVIDADYYDCRDFLRNLKILTGKNYDLPTEEEWEFAARGGNKSRGYQYSGSNNLSDVAWYSENSNGRIHPVKMKNPNELGIYDMSGNIEEWCSYFCMFGIEEEMKREGSYMASPRVAFGSSMHKIKCWEQQIWNMFGDDSVRYLDIIHNMIYNESRNPSRTKYFHVSRGGSIFSNFKECRPTARCIAENDEFYCGFRIVLRPKDQH